MTQKIIFLLILGIAIPGIYCECYVSINDDLGDPQTLVLKPGEEDWNKAFFLPTKEDEIIFEEGEVVEVACPGSTVNVAGTNLGAESAEAKCKSGSFQINGDTVAFNRIYCGKLPFHTARYTGKNCLGNNKEIEIGFSLKNNRFLKGNSICFDPIEQNTLYSQSNMTRYIGGYQVSFPRPEFIQDDFYDVNGSVEELYDRDGQRATINKLVGLSSSSTKYIDETGNYFNSRGHLTANTDFVYGSQQRSTFHYVNIAPQWQTLNGANWNVMEQDIRAKAENLGKDIMIYTGTHGKTTLPHEDTGKDVELWLYVNGNEKGIPVPQIFWKVLYEPTSKAGIALVGVNNPYHSNDFIEKNEVFCESICERVSWLNWKDPTDNQKGYSYCCEVDDLRKTVEEIPNFPVNSILL